jgi:hypothetical protein
MASQNCLLFCLKPNKDRVWEKAKKQATPLVLTKVGEDDVTTASFSFNKPSEDGYDDLWDSTARGGVNPSE